MVWMYSTQVTNNIEEKFFYLGWWPTKEKGWTEEDMDGSEVVRIDPKKYNLSEDLAQGRLEWRHIIHVADI